MVLASTWQLFTAHKNFPLRDLIRFSHSPCDISRTGGIIEKAESTENQTWSDKTRVQVRTAPWLGLITHDARPFRALICSKGSDIAFLRELSVWKHVAYNKY